MSATEAVRLGGWKIGTVLVSAGWKDPREVVYLDRVEVGLLNTQSRHRSNVKFFPEDVRESTEEEILAIAQIPSAQSTETV